MTTYQHSEFDDFPVTIPMSAEFVTFLGAASRYICHSMFAYFIREAKDAIDKDETCFITMSNHDWKLISCLAGWLSASYKIFDDFAEDFAKTIDAPDVDVAAEVLRSLPYISEHVSEYMMEVEKQYWNRKENDYNAD